MGYNNEYDGSLQEQWDSKHAQRSEAGNLYHASKSQFASNYMRNLSANHPELHGGMRTMEDMHHDLDTGHQIMSANWGGKAVFDRKSRTGQGAGFSIFHPRNEFQAQGQHQKAMELGYAANSHKYMQRQADAKRPTPSGMTPTISRLSQPSMSNNRREAASFETNSAPTQQAPAAPQKRGMFSRFRKG